MSLMQLPREVRAGYLRLWRRVLNGGDWYPRIAGPEPGTGTDKRMGRLGRLFLTGRSTHYIEFNGR